MNAIGAQSGARAGGATRAIALVGPYQSGKTTLLEAILARTGAISRQGRVADGNTVGDAAPEARAHAMSVELNAATCDFMGDRYTFVDCPGSVEFLHEMRNVLPACDLAIVVCEADEKKIPALQLILREIEDAGLPHIMFLNKIDKTHGSVREMLKVLQRASSVPLLLRQIPIRENGVATGFIDLARERAHIYRPHAESQVIDLGDAEKARETEARFSMLERLADYDDHLMEELLEDIEPPREEVFADLSREMREGLIVPVFIGAAENGNGILRLLKAVRHETPLVADAAARLGAADSQTLAQIVKTIHTPHGGKLSLARVLAGRIAEGDTLYNAEGAEARVGGVFTMLGQEARKVDVAETGDLVALGRLDPFATGQTIGAAKGVSDLSAVAAPPAVFSQTVRAGARKDEVRLSSALSKVIDEDPSLSLVHDADSGAMVLAGQGEMHLRVACERLTGKYGIALETARTRIGYRETIRRGKTQRGRHKKQSGGHGQFGDVVLDIAPLARGEGFRFTEKISGGVVPKQYFSAVEQGIRDYLNHGPLGFPVVDVGVALTDGSYHSVDSNDMAFRMAAILAMKEAMPDCSPVLLEPVMHVDISVPNDATAAVNGIVASRRGQILGFDARPGWPGWDTVSARIPQAELADLIVELRSATAGVGTYVARFDHLAELSGRLADQAIESQGARAA
ncbi:MAG: elongation factor G [Flavobacteriaceae bacterium]